MGRVTLREWLKENDYIDVLLLINEIIYEWEMSGKRTRRNWWGILAGDKNGNPRKVSGREMPVLRAAQIREGRTITSNAICRNKEEIIVPKWKTNRWPSKERS